MIEKKCSVDKTICNDRCSHAILWVSDHDINKARDSGLTVESLEFNGVQYTAVTLCQKALTRPDIIEKVRQVTKVKDGRRPTQDEIVARIVDVRDMQDYVDYRAATDSLGGI